MKDIKMLAEELKKDALFLRERVVEIYRSKGIAPEFWGMPDLLEALVQDLDKDKVSKKRMEDHAYGIFRIITDGSILENSEVGEDLISFKERIREFGSVFGEDK